MMSDPSQDGGKLRVGIVVQFVITGLLLLGAVGCAGGQAERRQGDLVERSDETSDDDILLESIVDVFDERGIERRVVSEEKGVVVGEWSEVNREVRHRWVARVIRANVGLVLKVQSIYERRDRSTGEARWVEAEDDLTLKQAHRDEQQLGAAIQERFRALGGGR